MVPFGLRFDLRVPDFAPGSVSDRYRAVLDMAQWAERVGVPLIVLSEHHGSPDGYLPSPLPVAAAITARTDRVRVLVSAMVTSFHDPLRLAEDIAVVDHLSAGRVDVVLTNGYVPDEFAMFDAALNGRAKRTEEIVTVLRSAWTGEPFEYRGRTVRVTPAPARPGGPPILLGGSTSPAARRAARIADGFIPSNEDAWNHYADERVALGFPDPGPYSSTGTAVLHFAADVDACWDHIGPFVLHEENAYGNWARAGGVPGATGFGVFDDVEAVRASGRFRVVTPSEFLEEHRAGSAPFSMLHPLAGGLPVEAAWSSLELLENAVLPHIEP
jgi:alkanesulfonate monooxygenase SsuD/methylene tetrahydromethanopterin reductase-like flavin-dependent oxidoreductase (luciferase family)